MEQKVYFVYILASKKNGTLYVGVTNNLLRRIQEHRKGMEHEFTAKYKVHNLVYFEPFDDIRDALTRERQLKNWRRAWKIELIECNNPEWNDRAIEV